MVEGDTVSDAEIKMMTMDPLSWLYEYKSGNQYRTFSTNAGSTAVSSSFAIDGSSEDFATQIYLMGDGTGDSVSTIKNQVKSGGSNYLTTTGLSSSDLVSVSIP